MKRETDSISGTVKLILGKQPYLWIGEPNGGPCMGCIDQKELRNFGNAILRELKKASRK